jgi:hypothetical protein
MIRVVLPFHLKRLAKVEGEVTVAVVGEVTQRAVLDALESQYPVLKGTIRDRDTARRRALVRFFACGEDHSDDAPDDPLPSAVAEGREPFLVVGSIAGG